jgi:hypothetical protein
LRNIAADIQGSAAANAAKEITLKCMTAGERKQTKIRRELAAENPTSIILKLN